MHVVEVCHYEAVPVALNFGESRITCWFNPLTQQYRGAVILVIKLEYLFNEVDVLCSSLNGSAIANAPTKLLREGGHHT